MQVLESLDPDLVMKALEKQLDAARVRRVAAGTESVRWKLRETASFGRSLPYFCWNPRNHIGHLITMDILCVEKKTTQSLRIDQASDHSPPKGPAVKQLGHWIATLESAIQQTTGAKLELVKVGGNR